MASQAHEATKLAVLIEPSRTATVIIDMQNDFCSPGGALDRAGRDVRAARSIIPAVRTLVEGSRRAGVPVVFVRSVYHSAEQLYLSEAWMEAAKRRGDGLYTDFPVCAEGTWGSELIPELQPQPEDLQVVKHRFSAFINTPLATILRAQNRDTLVFAGTVTYVCVESTVRDAFHLDYHNVIPADCVAGWNQDLHRYSLEVMRWGFGLVTESQAVLGAWEQRA